MRALFMVLMGLLVASAQAQTKPSAAMGIGTSTCAQFADLYRLDPSFEDTYFSWAQGFLSGWNSAQIAAKEPYWDLASLDTKAQEAYLRSYCDQPPLGNFFGAVMNLTTQFKRNSAP